MADNRMKLKCKVCKETMTIASMLMGTPYSISQPIIRGDEVVDNFFSKHMLCAYENDIIPDFIYDLVYETTEEEYDR